MSDDFFDPNSPDEDEHKTQDATPALAEFALASDLVATPAPELEESGAHRLEAKFDDPEILRELHAVTDEPATSPIDLVREASEAVEELVLDPLAGMSVGSQQGEIALPAVDPSMQQAPAADFIPVAQAASGSGDVDSGLIFEDQVDTAALRAKVRFYEEIQTLYLCELPFDILVEKALQALMRLVDAQAGSILEFDHNKNEYFFRASRGGASDKVQNFRIPAKQGIVGYVGESRQTMLINEMEDDQLQLKAISITVGFEARSCLAAPIIIANSSYGVVELFNKMGTLFFHERDKKSIEDGAAAIAKVLELRFLLAELVSARRSSK